MIHRWLRTTILISATLPFLHVSQILAGSEKTPIVVRMSTNKNNYELGENILVKYQVINVGNEPVYISPRLDFLASSYFGFYVSVRDALGNNAASGAIALDPGPTARKTSAEDVMREWILLRPGYFYGTEETLPFPPGQPGRYTLTGYYRSTWLPEPTGNRSDLKFAVVNGEFATEPISLQITKHRTANQ